MKKIIKPLLYLLCGFGLSATCFKQFIVNPLALLLSDGTIDTFGTFWAVQNVTLIVIGPLVTASVFLGFVALASLMDGKSK